MGDKEKTNHAVGYESDIKERLQPDEYLYRERCINCQTRIAMAIPRGILVKEVLKEPNREFKCPYCGCNPFWLKRTYNG